MKVMFNCVPRGVSNRRGAVCAHRARGDSRSLVEKRSWQDVRPVSVTLNNSRRTIPRGCRGAALDVDSRISIHRATMVTTCGAHGFSIWVALRICIAKNPPIVKTTFCPPQATKILGPNVPSFPYLPMSILCASVLISDILFWPYSMSLTTLFGISTRTLVCTCWLSHSGFTTAKAKTLAK